MRGADRYIPSCSSRITRRRARAFTLIEVIVALVVVSLGMLGVIQAVGQTASNSSYLREKTIAHWVAMNRLTQARLQVTPPKVDKTSDDVEMAGRKWRWTMNVTQTPVESIRRIDVSVRPVDAPENSSLASVSGFYGVAVAPPGTTVFNWNSASAQAPGAGGELGEGTNQGNDQGKDRGNEGRPSEEQPQPPESPGENPSEERTEGGER